MICVLDAVLCDVLPVENPAVHLVDDDHDRQDVAEPVPKVLVVAAVPPATISGLAEV